MADGTITHAEALDLIEEHIGEEVYVGFLVASADDQVDDLQPVQHVVGELANPLEPRPSRLEPEIGFYDIGKGGHHSFGLAPMAGTVQLRDNGIDFRPSETVLIRVAWRGSSEVGDRRPSREALAKFNALGVRMPEHEKPGVVLPSEGGEAGRD